MNNILDFGMWLIPSFILTFLCAYLGASLALRNVKFKIVQREMENGKTQVNVEPDYGKPAKRAEFITDPDQAKLDELNQEPAMKRFLSGFKKPQNDD